MSDKTDKPGQPKQDAGKTAGDKRDEPKPDPQIERLRVRVDPKPRDPRNPVDREVAKKVKTKVEEKVREAIEKAKDGGHRKQVDAGEKAAQDEGKKINKGNVKEVKVRIEGDIKRPGGRRDGVDKTIIVEPSG